MRKWPRKAFAASVLVQKRPSDYDTRCMYNRYVPDESSFLAYRLYKFDSPILHYTYEHHAPASLASPIISTAAPCPPTQPA